MWLTVKTVLNGYEEKSYWCRYPQVKVGNRTAKIKKKRMQERPKQVPKPLNLCKQEAVWKVDAEDGNNSTLSCLLGMESQTEDLVIEHLHTKYGKGEQSSDVFPLDSISGTIEQVMEEVGTDVATPWSLLVKSVQESVHSVKNAVTQLFTPTSDPLGYGELEGWVGATSTTKSYAEAARKQFVSDFSSVRGWKGSTDHSDNRLNMTSVSCVETYVDTLKQVVPLHNALILLMERHSARAHVVHGVPVKNICSKLSVKMIEEVSPLRFMVTPLILEKTILHCYSVLSGDQNGGTPTTVLMKDQ